VLWGSYGQILKKRAEKEVAPEFDWRSNGSTLVGSYVVTRSVIRKEQEMKSSKLVMIAAIACMSVIFLSNPAYAQLGEVIGDYCEEISNNVADTVEALEDASFDLTECALDLNECMLGQGLFDEPSNCIRDYTRCTAVGKRDQADACSTFLREFLNDTRRAERDADREDVENAFLNWFHGDSDLRNECIQPAEDTLAVCADELHGEE